MAVVSRGDEELLKLDGPEAWHFPREEGGAYAGHHPADDAEAITLLEEFRGQGADFLLFPSEAVWPFDSETAFWWLDHYEGFRRHLDKHYERIWGDEQCIIYRLTMVESPVDVGRQLGDDSSIERSATKREARSGPGRLLEELTMALTGWVRKIMGRTRGDEDARRPTGYGSSGDRGAGELTATPNPVPAGAGQGTTTIEWSTGDDSEGQVYLRVGDEPETLFAQFPRGSQAAPYIGAGPTYEFRLYSGTERERLLDSVEVTRNKE